MGDGMTDSGRRGELGDEGNEQWLLERLPMRCHRLSYTALTHIDTISRLEESGRITVDDRDGWLTINKAE